VKFLRSLIEVLALLAALACFAPVIPSHEGYVHQFGPMQAIGTVLFAVSRALRWQKRWWIALPEAAGFAVVAYVLQWSYNML
jgi:hypothetical protein